MKTSELTGAQLDWAVAKCEALPTSRIKICPALVVGEIDVGTSVWLDGVECRYTSRWAQGGPIIEREKIELIPLWLNGNFEGYAASHRLSVKYDEDGEFIYGSDCKQYNPTPLIAALRCFIASKLGDEVDVPEELK